jgi:hypothetical protein
MVTSLHPISRFSIPDDDYYRPFPDGLILTYLLHIREDPNCVPHAGESAIVETVSNRRHHHQKNDATKKEVLLYGSGGNYRLYLDRYFVPQRRDHPPDPT